MLKENYEKDRQEKERQTKNCNELCNIKVILYIYFFFFFLLPHSFFLLYWSSAWTRLVFYCDENLKA